MEAPALSPSLRVDARLELGVAGIGSRLTARHEAGALRWRMPRLAERRGAALPCEALIVNVAGGLAGGDRVAIRASAEAGAQLAVSSATAERIYRSVGEVTHLSFDLVAREAGALVWLPQETVIHDGARVHRVINIDVAAGARLLFGDITHLGRIASGEQFLSGNLRERWRVRYGARLILADEMRLDGLADPARLRNPALLGDATTIATLILLGRDATERLDAIRAALASHADIEAGATARDGLVFARLIGKDGAATRRAYAAAIRAASAPGLYLPRLIAAECDET